MKDRMADGMTDDELDRALASLPYPTPDAGFADRVMARVAVPAPVEVYRPAAVTVRRPLAVAASLAVVVAGSLASVLWTLGHQPLVAALGQWLTVAAGEWTWQGAQALAQTLITLSGSALARVGAISLSTVAAASALGSLVYLTGLLALRRLMVTPTRQAMHAQH